MRSIFSAEYVFNAALTHLISKGFEGMTAAILQPTAFTLYLATSAATSATVYLLMTAGKLLIAGTFIAIEKTADGVRYVFYSGAPTQRKIPQFNEEFDSCDAPIPPPLLK